MRLGRSVLALAMSLALAPGCSEITEFPEGAVIVRATHALPEVRDEIIDFTASVGVDNFSTRTIYVDETCGWVLQRLEAGAWVDAYIAPCLPVQPQAEVEPGSTHIFTLTAFVLDRTEPEAEPAGTYRLILDLEASYSPIRRQEVPLEQRTSNEFVVP